MPFINGRFYMNPAYGRAAERARGSEAIVKLGQTVTVTYTHEDEQGKTVTRSI
jgi:hypothetical protein